MTTTARAVRRAGRWFLAAAAVLAAAAAGVTAPNRVPLIAANVEGPVVVRPERGFALVVEASDPDADPADPSLGEAVQLQVDLSAGDGAPLPAWLGGPHWTSGPASEARLEIELLPPADAVPAVYELDLWATDARGLTAHRTVELRVLGPLCDGPLAYEAADGSCRTCPDHQVPNASKTTCEACPAGTERPGAATSCADCQGDMTSEAGSPCDCGPARRLTDAGCVDCPLDTDSRLNPFNCTDCPPGQQRRGLAGCMVPRVAGAGALALQPEVVSTVAAAQSSSNWTVTLTLDTTAGSGNMLADGWLNAAERTSGGSTQVATATTTASGTVTITYAKTTTDPGGVCTASTGTYAEAASAGIAYSDFAADGTYHICASATDGTNTEYSSPVGFRVDGTTPALSDGSFTIADPAHAAHAGRLVDATSLTWSLAVFVKGDYAYVAATSADRLAVVDISDPTGPALAATLTNGTNGARLDGPRAVFVHGDVAYLASESSDALEIVDVSDPRSPAHLGSISHDADLTDASGSGATLDGPYGVFVTGGHAYVTAHAANALAIVDVSDPTAPRHVSTVTGTAENPLSGPSGVYVTGGHAFVAAFGSDALAVIDVSDPAAPSYVGSLAHGGDAKLAGANSVAVRGGYAYVTSSGALEVVDVSTPSSPTHAGHIVHDADLSDSVGSGASLSGAAGVFLSGDYAYVAAHQSRAVEIVDVSDPTSPTHAGSAAAGVAPYSVFVRGNHAYATSFSSNSLETITVGKTRASAGDAVVLEFAADEVVTAPTMTANGVPATDASVLGARVHATYTVGATDPETEASTPYAASGFADAAGNAGNASGALGYVVDLTAPTIESAAFNDSTITLTLSEAVWVPASIPATDFAVTDDGAAATVTAVAGGNSPATATTTVTLTLSSTLAAGSIVSITYTPNTDASLQVWDVAGNALAAQTVQGPRPTLVASIDWTTLAEDAGRVRVDLTLENPPATGRYTGCRLQLASGSTAGSSDVSFHNTNQRLRPSNGWTKTGVRLLGVVDDALAEGDEALLVEGVCTGSDAGTVPAHGDLVATPLALTIEDNEELTITLTVDPDALDETASATDVTVTATLGAAVAEALDVALDLSGTAVRDTDYTVSGTETVTVPANASTGTTTLTVTPAADADDTDETITVAATVTDYAVTWANIAIQEEANKTAIELSLDDSATSVTEGDGDVQVTMTLVNPPDAGRYNGCRVRLATGGTADASDVTFKSKKKLRATDTTPWSARAKLMRIVDDSAAEGDETLVVEGYCTGSTDADPAHTALVSRPLTLTLVDNDNAGTVTLTLSPDTVGETGGEQTVTVTGTVDSAPTADLTVALSLGSGDYSVSGTQSLTIGSGETSGSTSLAITPSGDSDSDDDTVTVSGTASGYAVTAATLTIAEPTLVGGVDVSNLAVRLAVSPSAVKEGTSGTHTVTATLTGVSVPDVDVALTLSVGGTATEGTAHDYTLTGTAGWQQLTIAANDAHMTTSVDVTVSALSDAQTDGTETVTFETTQITWGTTAVALDETARATLSITEAWDAPGTPTNVTATPAAGNETRGLTMGWDPVTATPPVDGYAVRYRPQGTSVWTEATTTATTLTVSGLTAGTEYEVQVAARNAKQLGPYSSSVHAFTGDGDCVTNAPSVTSPSGQAGITELEVTWDAPSCTSTIVRYELRYREDPDIEGVTNAFSDASSTTTSATLSSLTANTAYVIQVKAVASNGDKGPWSALGKGKTTVDTRLPPRLGAPVVAPNAVSGGEQLDATWLRATWTDGDGTAHALTAYQYRYRVSGGTWTEATDATATTGETESLTRTLTGLSASTWYDVQVRAVNTVDGASHMGKWSEPGRGRTWGVPDRVQEPSAYRTDTSVEVVWKAPDNGGTAIDDYDVQYKKDTGGWLNDVYAGCTGSGACATQATIDVAAERVRVRASNAIGDGAWSRTADVQTRKLLRVSYGAATGAVNEGESLLVEVELDKKTDRSVTVPITVTPATGPFRVDGASNNVVTFGFDTKLQTFTLVATDDDADNEDERVTLGFGDLPDGVILATPASLVVTIDDDEASNGKPSFADGATTTRSVPENTAAGGNVGAAVTATDPDNDALTYTLGGADAALFDIDATTGQITVGAGTTLDFEGSVQSYTVTVSATDGKDGAGTTETTATVDATITVTIAVSDVTETPEAPDAPTLDPGATTMAASWTEPGNTGPAVNDYDVQYKTSAESAWTAHAHDGDQTTATLTGLSAGTVYEVQVRASSDEGTGAWSATATANTLPAVTVSASDLTPDIGADDAAVTVTLSGAATVAGGGTLDGEWIERDVADAITVLAGPTTLTSGVTVMHAVSESAPKKRAFGFRATHTLDGRTSTATAWADIVEWRPSIALAAAPAVVAEDAGATTVTMTARVTGTSLSSQSKSVTVSVAGGTATVLDDFAAVSDFTIAVPASTRSATGTFVLTPVVDQVDDDDETVTVTGSATEGDDAVPVTVIGTAVTIGSTDRTLTFTAPSNGYVIGKDPSDNTVIDCGPSGGTRTDCSETVAKDTVITLTPHPDTGYLFDGWTGDCSGTNDPLSLTMDADHGCGATFAQPTLTITPPSNGYVIGKDASDTTVIDCGPSGGTRTDCNETVTKDTVITLTPTADTGYVFKGWTGDCSGTDDPLSLTVDADHGCGVNFGQPTLTITAPSNGYVIGKDASDSTVIDCGPSGGSRTDCSETVAKDDVITLTPHADSGYAFNGWSGDCSGSANPLSVTVNADHDCGAAFGQTTTLTITAPSDGYITGTDANSATVIDCGPSGGSRTDCTETVTKDAVITLTPNADTGYAFNGWSGGCSGTDDPLALTMDANKTCSATFAQPTLTITPPSNGYVTGNDENSATVIDCGPTGGTRTDCSETVSKDAVVTLTPTADTGHAFKGWSGDCSGTDAPLSLTVDADKTCEASFAQPTLTVTAPSNGHITGTDSASNTVIDCGSGGRSDCTETVSSGTTITLSASPDTGYAFGGFSGACSGVKDCTVTVDADKTVGGSFGTARTLTVTAPTDGSITGTNASNDAVIDCGSDCTATVAEGAVVDLKAVPATNYGFSAWSGDCTSPTASCSLTLDADKTAGASFTSAVISGACDETQVDGCSAGDLNTTDVSDTDTHHQWRCDGKNGGTNSATCQKAKQACSADDDLDWTVDGVGCTGGAITAANSGETRTSTDNANPNVGSASFRCDDGAWVEQIGSTCESCTTAVDGDWSATSNGTWANCSATDCGTSGTRSRSWSRTCTDPAPYCGGADCTGDASGTESETCYGTSCPSGQYCSGSGSDGSCTNYCAWDVGNWTACSATACGSSGTQTRSVTCGTGCVCNEGNKPGTSRECHGRSCSSGTNCSGSGTDGSCVPNPGCGTTENTCNPGTLTDTTDTAPVDGACAAKETEGCLYGQFRDETDSSRLDAVCGTGGYHCLVGSLRFDTPDTDRKFKWTCVGIPTATAWTCLGTDGAKNWSCTSGVTKACSIGDQASDPFCYEILDPALDAACESCKGCTGANEEPDDDCDCVCKSGYSYKNGACTKD